MQILYIMTNLVLIHILAETRLSFFIWVSESSALCHLTHFFQSSSLPLCSHASHLPSHPSICSFLYTLFHFLTFPVARSLSFIFLSSCVQNRQQTCWLRRPRLQRRRLSCWPRKPPRPRRRCNALKWRPSAARRSDGSWSRRCWKRRYWLSRWQRNRKGGMEMRIESGWASIHLVTNDSRQKQCLKLCQPSHESWAQRSFHFPPNIWICTNIHLDLFCNNKPHLIS